MIIVNKRFIRIVDHLEKEVRIYDTINEKKIFNIFFNELDSAIGLNGALTDTVDLLNDLSEENDVLKQQLSEQGTEIDFLKDENTHMKCVLNKRRFRNNGQGNKLLHSWEVWRMNEKRFTLEEFGLNFIVNDNGRNLTAKQTVELLNELNDENKQLKDALNQRTEQCDKYYKENEQLKQQTKKLEAQLYCPFDSICIQCKNEYLVQKEEYYISKCKKGHEQCSKVDVKYCDDFEVKELQE